MGEERRGEEEEIVSGNSWGVIVEQVRVRRKVGRQAG